MFPLVFLQFYFNIYIFYVFGIYLMINCDMNLTLYDNLYFPIRFTT